MMVRVLYEDDDLIFVDKPSGIVVQRGYDQDEPILIDWVRDHLAPSGTLPFLLQRLDRGTSGVIFFSKIADVNRALTKQFEAHVIRKLYVALCEGVIAEPQVIDAPLARIGAIKFGVRAEGRRAVTRIVPVASAKNATLLAISLRTGRTHQIRVHLAAIGHPLVGDWLYGDRNDGRPMLHAMRLRMQHPRTRVSMAVEAPLPDDFLAAVSASGIDASGARARLSETADVLEASEGG